MSLWALAFKRRQNTKSGVGAGIIGGDRPLTTAPLITSTNNTVISKRWIDTSTQRSSGFCTVGLHHFAYVLAATEHTEHHLWVTIDGDFIFVKGTVVAPSSW